MAEELEEKIYVVEIGERTVHYVSFLPHDLVFKYGLKGSVIVGSVDAIREDETPEQLFSRSFRPNPEFRTTLNTFIDKVLRNSEGLKTAALNQKDGYVYIIDQRTPTPEGEVTAVDIIGAFEVENSDLESYRANLNHELRSENGFLNFGEEGNRMFLEWLGELLRNDA